MKLEGKLAVMLQAASNVMLSKNLETILNIMWRNMKVLNYKMKGWMRYFKMSEPYRSEHENLEMRMSITIYGNNLGKI